MGPITRFDLENQEIQARIADALERIAKCMEDHAKETTYLLAELRRPAKEDNDV